MRDRDVRHALHDSLRREHAGELESTLFVDELGLCGAVRVDVAVVNGALSGFELKSAADTLARLPKQVAIYSQVLDYSTLVVAENHLDKAARLLPTWWGCTVARTHGEALWLDEIRPATFNPSIDPFALAQLLWREEALDALEGLDAAAGVRSKPRRDLWAKLVMETDLTTLRNIVRDSLKSRSGWRKAHELTTRRADLALA